MDPMRAALREMNERMKNDPDNICDRCGKPIELLQLATGLRHIRAGRYKATGFEPIDTCACPAREPDKTAAEGTDPTGAAARTEPDE